MVTLDDRIHFPFQLVFIPFLNSSHVILLTAELSVDQPGNTVVSSLVLLFFLFKCYTHCGHTTCKIKICWLVNSWSLSLPVLGLQKELLTFRLSSHFYQSNQRSTLCQLSLAFFSWKIEVNFSSFHLFQTAFSLSCSNSLFLYLSLFPAINLS